jgi:hypothetical protein
LLWARALISIIVCVILGVINVPFTAKRILRWQMRPVRRFRKTILLGRKCITPNGGAIGGANYPSWWFDVRAPR